MIFLGWCSAVQLEKMFLKFYIENKGAGVEKLAKKFANDVLSHKKNVSPAQIQGFFLFYKNDPQVVVNNVSKIWDLT